MLPLLLPKDHFGACGAGLVEMLSDASIETFPAEAVMVAGVEVRTVVVVTVKLAEVVPHATVTVGGGTAFGLLDDRLTLNPPNGAGPVRVTVPEDQNPPGTDVGFSVSPLSVPGGVIARFAVTEFPPTVAVITAVVSVVTADVVIVKDAEVAPAGTTTVVGGTALELLDDRFTVVPPEGAGPFSVTVPTEGVPPNTELGVNVTLVGTGGLTVRLAVTEIPPKVAVMVAAVEETTG